LVGRGRGQRLAGIGFSGADEAGAAGRLIERMEAGVVNGMGLFCAPEILKIDLTDRAGFGKKLHR
jgi:hypothetical protein